MSIKCDKCGSLNVEKVRLNPSKIEPKTMSEYIKQPKFSSMTLEVRYHKYALQCLDCGHRVEYWE